MQWHGETFQVTVYLDGFPVALFKTRDMAVIFCEQNKLPLSSIKDAHD